MIFLARILRFLFWVIIVSWGFKLLGRFISASFRIGTVAPPQTQDGQSDTPQVSDRRLVRDPVCGVHVAEVLSIPLRVDGELLHFCSTACRDKYLASTQKIAANG